MIARYLGWDGRAPANLEQVGREYGLTRERVRQICARVAKRFPGASTPVLDRCLAFAAAAVPGDAASVEAALVAAGDLPANVTLADLLRIADQFGRRRSFSLVGMGATPLLVGPDGDRVVAEIRQAARRAIEHWGVVTVDEMAAKVAVAEAELVRWVLVGHPGFMWLDEPSGWFWVPTRRNRLLNHIRKVLAVATQDVTVAALRDAVRRHYRWQGVAAPRRVLLEFCRHTPGLVVEGNVIRAEPTPNATSELSPNERVLVRVLSEHGGIMGRLAFQDACVAAGMNRSTFMVYLDNSPVLMKYARGVYGLVGHTPPPGVVTALAPKIEPGRRLLDVG